MPYYFGWSKKEMQEIDHCGRENMSLGDFIEKTKGDKVYIKKTMCPYRKKKINELIKNGTEVYILSGWYKRVKPGDKKERRLLTAERISDPEGCPFKK